MSGILKFSHHKLPARGRPNPARLFERAAGIQSSLPRIAQLVIARHVMAFFWRTPLFAVTQHELQHYQSLFQSNIHLN